MISHNCLEMSCVEETRKREAKVYRRRICNVCGKSFSTYEVLKEEIDDSEWKLKILKSLDQIKQSLQAH